ncbi:putative wd40 domain-containing protein [Phaeomoniella chlamydospora]|uniref:Putative wd40 domain-containing protein n=1 Tax=Phaeomoniella chlamydospora TaxID=158046 RepID=A0A0G2F0Y6_PHACM|nr:putative wd40 domain-containing protein [Phaeomoniella chlamydospora]
MSTSLGTSYRQSVPSPSSQYLAFITEDAKDLAIINTSPSPPPYGRLCRRIKLQDPRFAARVATIRWTPQSSTTDDGILDEGSLPLSSESIQSALATSPRILLSDGRHIQVYTTLDPGSYRTGSQKLHSLIYNIDLGTTFGKTTHVDFLLNHHHIIALTETNVHATILTIDGELGGPKYIELKPAPKSGLPVPNILTLHPKSKNHFSILGKASDGKDVVSTYRYSYNEVEPWSVEVRNVLSTYDAQGFCWSPDGRFVAVWDTPSMGCNVRFYTGDGLELEHMCIDKIMPGYGISEPQDGIEGLGVKSLNWFSKDQILGITDFDGNVVLRKLDEGYRCGLGYLLCSNPSKSTSNSQINFHSTLFTDTRTEAKATSPSFPESNPKSQAIESDNENKNENYDQEIETETEIEINTPTHAPLKRVRAMRSGKGNENVKEKTRTENAKTNSNSENRTGSEKKQKTPKSKREVTR